METSQEIGKLLAPEPPISQFLVLFLYCNATCCVFLTWGPLSDLSIDKEAAWVDITIIAASIHSNMYAWEENVQWLAGVVTD